MVSLCHYSDDTEDHEISKIIEVRPNRKDISCVRHSPVIKEAALMNVLEER